MHIEASFASMVFVFTELQISSWQRSRVDEALLA